MKKLGLIGGISWVSTADYYRLINQGANDKLGGLNFAECIIYSFNYADIKKNNDNNDWDKTFARVLEAAEYLKDAGAEGLILCANTMHLIADRLQEVIGLPIIHIATATANDIKRSALKKVGLLGTRFTMELDFFRSKLADQDIDTIIPGIDDRLFIQETIYNELGKGIIVKQTKERYIAIVNELISSGAEGIILGCTEIPLVVQPVDVKIKIFDTTQIHARAAVEFALG
ncbi:aspartate racemase [Mucilaginibacter sp. PPCGB 2223]|uniref:aspartate/glutamate racemase family protein n=1 Tax=Mucilaginibacter sp. PPCGB 2223 TaxID=1886027 RepID=UPI00082530FA|nr:aspartate/glutamate racemase family protein [Mucilaginibacter sp. PPCGB 2223]OCX52031.1 aspartate racemase [Mucilaginibacter sp. PPCGB 2223]